MVIIGNLIFIKYGSPLPEGDFIRDDKYENLVQCYKNRDFMDEIRGVCNGVRKGICPITQDTMVEPAILMDGSVYEKSAVITWFNSKDVIMAECFRYMEKAREGNRYERGLAFCSQWGAMYKYISPSTNLKLCGEPIMYLPLTDTFILL